MENSYNNKIILAVAAHPDDLEFCAAGTILEMTKQGATAYYVVLTDGSKGSEDAHLSPEELTKTRQSEQRKAAKLLGVKQVFFLDFIDGELEVSHDTRKALVKIIRQIKPNIVICWDPTLVYDENIGAINHPDHRASGQITLDSVFPFARNSRTYPDLLKDGHQPHSVEEVLLINFTKQNFYIDITESIDTKLKALACHQSQHDDSQFVTKWVKSQAEQMGTHLDTKYAEGFIRIQISE